MASIPMDELRRRILDAIPVGVIVWHLTDPVDEASLRLVTFNHAAERLLGAELGERVGLTMGEAFPSTNRARWKLYFDVVKSGRPVDLGEIRYREERLGEADFWVIACPVSSEHVAAVFENVTRRSHVEKELQRVNSFLDAIIEHLPAMLFVKEAKDLRFERINRAAEELLGLSREALLGKNDYDFFPPTQATFFQSIDRETLASGQMVDIHEEAIQTALGQRWLHTRKIPITGPDGPTHLLGVSIDITARKKAQESLATAEANFRLLVERCPEAMFVHRDDTIAYVNPAFSELFGWRDEAIGRPLESLFHPDEPAARHLESLRVGEGQSSRVEIRCVTGAGEIVVIEAAGVACEFDGEPSVVVVARDITLRKQTETELEARVQERTAELLKTRASLRHEVGERERTEAALQEREQQLIQSQKMEAIGRLAGGVAHDFNNLLTIILSYSALALNELREGDPLRDDILQIREAGQRASSLTHQLLAFSRRQLLEPRIVDLNSVLEQMDRMLRRVIGEDLDFRTVAGPGLGSVRVDPTQIEQVLMNLAVNARDAMPQGGSLTIETSNVVLDESYTQQHAGVVAGAYVMLAVSDTGVGMDKATLARIFEPFFTTKEQGKGTGLGLAMVYGIIRQSGGHLWVYSEPGKGTTFKLYFPRLDAAAEQVRPDSGGVPVLRGSEKILLVEDEEQVRLLVRNVLRRNGYQVHEARTPAEAIGISSELRTPIDLLVTDVVMPQMSGRQLARALHAHRPEMRVLYVSGYTDNTIVHHGVLDPGLAFLQKPLTPDVLLRKVREVLEATVAPTI